MNNRRVYNGANRRTCRSANVANKELMYSETFIRLQEMRWISLFIRKILIAESTYLTLVRQCNY